MRRTQRCCEDDAVSDAHPTTTTGRAVRSALTWNAANFAVSQAASALIFFFLAAQLPPAVFGVFALGLLLTDIFATQGRSAMTDSLVQQQDFSPAALNAAFWCGMAVAAVFLAAGLLARDWLAHLFAEDSLADVLPALAASLLLVPAIAVMEALVLRDLDFRAISLRNMAGVIIGGAAGLAVVVSPAAPWAPVVQRVVQTAVSVIFLWARTRWSAGLPPNLSLMAAYARRTGQFWGVQAVSIGPQRLLEAIVGLKLGAADLGVLRVAGKFFEILHGSLTAAIMALWMPILPKLRDDPVKRRVFFLRLMALGAMLCIPAQLGLGLIGPELARVFLSADYAFAGTIMFIGGFNAISIPLAFFRGSVLSAMGRGRTAMTLGGIEIVICISCLWLFIPFGFAAGLSAYAAAATAVAVLSGWVMARTVNISFVDFITAIRPAYEGAIGLMIAIWLTAQPLAGANPLLALGVLILAGAAGYGATLGVLHPEWVRANIAYLRSGRSEPRAD
jgi:O-antigen/teichoic acid export membrane protein